MRKSIIGNSTAYNEDWRDVLPLYPDNYFHLATCDVEYGIGVGKMAYLTEMNTTVRQKNGTKLNPNRTKKKYTKKDWDNKPPEQDYFDELCRVSRHQIIFGVDYVKWQGLGTGRIKWDKGVPNGVSFNRYERAYCSMIEDEYILQLLWAGMCQAKSLSEPMTQQGNKKLNEKRIHPTHKPTMLYEAIYLKFGLETKHAVWGVNDAGSFRVLDTHLGGGSNRIACDKLGYEFVACEIDKEYFDKQEARFAQHKSKLILPFY